MNTAAVAQSPLSTAEQALLWRQLMAHTPGGIFGLEAVRDEQTGAILDFRYRFINKAALDDISRRQPDAQPNVTGHLFSTYFPSVRQSPLWNSYLTVLDTQEAIQGDGAFLFDGHSLRVRLAISPFEQDGILVSYNEVSESNREPAFDQPLARVQNRLDSSPSAVVVVDAVRDADGRPVNFRVKAVDQLFERLTGQPADSFAGMPLDRIYSFQPGHHDALIRLMDTGLPIRHEACLTAQDCWLDMVLTRTDDGFVATLQTISSQRRSPDQLEQQARLLEGLMNTVQNGISVLEAVRDEAGRLTDFCFVEISRALLAGLTLTREQVVGNHLLTILPGLRNTIIWPIYLRVLETGVAHQFEHHYNTDGYDRYFDLSVARLNDGLVVSYKNITDVKRVQLQLETLVVELRRSNESLDQFAYVASHDLQEPLRKIVSFGDVLQQQAAGELSDSTTDIIRRMQNAAARMRILVQDLLTYSRLTGHPALYQPVSLDKLVAGLLSDVSDLTGEQRVSITVSALPAVRGDSRLLGHLFQNLIGNALKFTKPDQPGSLTIAGRLAYNPDVLPAVGRCAEISLTDTGIGFDEKYLDRIFIVFQRLHSQQQYVGTGIGLAICKKVVDLHGGAITARSQPGVGATFTVWLPAV